jgi:hypothetical protein
MPTVRHLPGRIPRATIRCCETLLQQALLGRMTGLAFVAILPEGFVADACGEAHNDPATTRQMVAILDAKLAKRARAK